MRSNSIKLIKYIDEVAELYYLCRIVKKGGNIAEDNNYCTKTRAYQFWIFYINVKSILLYKFCKKIYGQHLSKNLLHK